MRRQNKHTGWVTYVSYAVVLLSSVLSACGGTLEAPEIVQGSLTGLVPAEAERPSDRARRPGTSVMLDGATLLVSRDSKLAVAIEPNQALVHLVDLERRSVETLQLEKDSEPSRPVEDAFERIHLLLRGTGDVLSIRRDGTILARQRVCEEVNGLTSFTTPGEEQLKVVCGSGRIITLAADGLLPRAVHTLAAYDDLRDPITVNGELWVSQFRQARVLRIGPDGGLRGLIKMPSYKDPADVQHDLDARVAWRLIKLPDAVGGALVLHQQHVMGFTGDYWCTPPNCPEGHVTRLGRSFTIEGGGHLFGTSLPVDGAVSRSGKNMMVVAAGNIPMPVKGAQAPTESPLRWGPLAKLAIKPGLAGIRFPSGPPLKPVAIASYKDEGFAFQAREHRSLYLIENAQASPEPGKWIEIPLGTGPSEPDVALDLFQAAAPNRGPCASCHPNGREDAVAVTLDMDNAKKRARRTQSLNVGLKETAPLHWDGAQSNLPALIVHDMKEFGLPPVAVNDPNILLFSDWLDGQPRPWRYTSPTEQPAVAAGQQVFQDQLCTGCHAPAFGYTIKNNKSVNGTEPAYQVPSLRGVSFRAPYFHDGCAADLVQVFNGQCAKPGSGGAGVHDLAAKGLSSASIDNLISFLGTL